MSRRLSVLLLLGLAAGCSSVTDKLDSKVDYKSAGTLPTLEVPPDLTAPARDNRFVVPESGKSSATLSGYEAERKDPARGGNTSVLAPVEQMRVERAGSERWLVVPQPPDKLWAVVKDFWQQNGFLVKLEVAEAGVMETDWAENRAKIPQGSGIRGFLSSMLDSVYSTAERDKFRTRLERTPDGKGTEIYISHRGMVEVYTNPRDDHTVWQPREPDPGLEAEFLRRLMVRLGAQQEQARQLAASPGETTKRAELAKSNDGRDALKVFEPFDRAWRRVGLALDRVGFTVEDRDRQKGLYFVRYADPEGEMEKAKPGLLSRIFNKKEAAVKAEQYRVQVRQDKDGSQVNVLNKDGGAETSKTAQRILALLHEQLK